MGFIAWTGGGILVRKGGWEGIFTYKPSIKYGWASSLENFNCKYRGISEDL
jgi:hypothetical protein